MYFIDPFLNFILLLLVVLFISTLIYKQIKRFRFLKSTVTRNNYLSSLKITTALFFQTLLLMCIFIVGILETLDSIGVIKMPFIVDDIMPFRILLDCFVTLFIITPYRKDFFNVLKWLLVQLHIINPAKQQNEAGTSIFITPIVPINSHLQRRSSILKVANFIVKSLKK